MNENIEDSECDRYWCIFIGGCFYLIVGIVSIIWGINFIISLFKG